MGTQIFLNSQGVGSNGIFTQTANSTPVGGPINASGNLIGTGVGSLTVPANGFQVGDSFRLSMGGHLDSVNNKVLNIFGIEAASSATLFATGNITMPGCTDEHWNLEVIFTIRAIGAAGVASIASSGYFIFTKDAAFSFEGENFSAINNTTFDTTINTVLSIKATWNDGTVGNSIYSETGVLTKIY